MDDAELRKLLKKSYKLLDTDPQAAVMRIRALPDMALADGLTTQQLRAGFFVDASSVMKDLQLACEGRAVLEAIHTERPERLDVLYCLANAWGTEGQLRPCDGPSWYLETLQLRQKARAAYQEVIERTKTSEDLRARAQTNLGNELWRAHRWVEAYDAYQSALGIDHTNAVARTGAVKVLLRARDLGIGDPGVAEAVAARHLREAAGFRNRIWELAGHAAVKELENLLALDLAEGDPPDLSLASNYERFVAANRLALATTIEGLSVDLKRWDSLHISSIIEDIGAGPGVPPTFAIFNTAKADYLAARWLCYQALEGELPETGVYHDTLDYAVYGVRSSLLMLAQRACVDTLDKIALLLTEYFGLGESPRSITFRTRWHRRDKDSIAGWHDSLASEFESGNRGLIALADVATDLAEDGYLGRKKSLRDAATHRALVIHDISLDASRESPYVTHIGDSELHAAVLDTLRLARASLLYAIEAIAFCESRKKSKHEGFLGQLTVPTHHWVRGENEELLSENEEE